MLRITNRKFGIVANIRGLRRKAGKIAQTIVHFLRLIPINYRDVVVRYSVLICTNSNAYEKNLRSLLVRRMIPNFRTIVCPCYSGIFFFSETNSIHP